MQKYGIENGKIMDTNFDLDQWYFEEMYNKTISIQEQVGLDFLYKKRDHEYLFQRCKREAFR